MAAEIRTGYFTNKSHPGQLAPTYETAFQTLYGLVTSLLTHLAYFIHSGVI